jgi:hypothetical protein
MFNMFHLQLLKPLIGNILTLQNHLGNGKRIIILYYLTIYCEP